MNIAIRIILILLLVLVSVYLVIHFFYLPRYIFEQTQVELSDENTDEMTIMTLNIRRYANDDLYEKSWFYRASLITKDINSAKPDIIGFQEVTWVQYCYLIRNMPDYANEIKYRDKSFFSEGCPILYRKDKFERIDSGTFWLSNTPDIMSKDWGSSNYRICTYVILRDRINKKEFVVFNTHLDHKSYEARTNGIQVILNKLSKFGNIPAFLMGDLNSLPSSAIISATQETFDDSYNIALNADVDAYNRIDYIMITKGSGIVSEYRVVNNCYDGVYSSDHSPIYIKVKFK